MLLRETYLPSVVREPFESRIDRLFEDAFRLLDWRPAEWLDSSWTPHCDVYEDESSYVIQFGLPGWESKDVDIHVENGVLTVKGERKAEMSQADRTYHCRELAWGAFCRAFELPSHVDPDKATATFSQGILTIQVPKREEARPRRILIESK
jgi:HSP20 family protein